MGEVILFFLIVIFALMLLQATFGVFGAIWGAIGEFLFNTKWGILSIIFFGLSAILFYASSKTYLQAREKGRVINTIKPLLHKMDNFYKLSKESVFKMSKQPKSLMSRFGNEDNVIDLSRVDLQTMVRKLAIAINKPNPVFFKGWGNKRLELDVERTYIIKDYIDAVIAAGESFVRLNADAILSYEKIEKLVQINRNVLLKQLKESELEIDLLQREHQAKVNILRINIRDLEATVYEKLAQIEQVHAKTKEILGDLENRSKEVTAEIERMRKESDSAIKRSEEESRARIKLDGDKSKAEIFVMKLKATDTSRISNQRAKVLDKIIDEMNLNAIRPIDVYLLIKLLETTSTDNYLDFDSRIKMVDEQIERMKIDNNKATAEAREAHAKADEVVAQSKQNVKDLYKNS
jgi:hypothetical protein